MTVADDDVRARERDGVTRRGPGHQAAGPEVVSLVITCFNHASFLADAIESALSQERPFDEIIVVDDGSTDGSAAVAEHYPGVRCLRQSNRGLAAARNRGLEEASGSFIVFLDADDRLTPAAVRAGLDCFRVHPSAVLVYGAFRHIDALGAATPQVPLRPCDDDPYACFLRGNPVGMHACVMYRRVALVDVGGFDQDLKACEDYDLYLRLASQHTVACHPALVAEYRLHESNMSGDPRRMLAAVLDVLDRQHARVRGEARLANAWRDGRRTWQDYYGARLAERAVARLRRSDSRSSAVGDLAYLLRRAPHALVSREFDVRRIVVRRVLPWLPRRLRVRAAARWPGLGYRPRRGDVAFGDLRRLEPFSREFGFDRGRPIDRHYIEAFLSAHADDVRGRVLEIGDNEYTLRYGGDRVTMSDVLNVHDCGGNTTIVSDLATGKGIPDGAFDCLIITQTLHLVFDVPAAIRTMYRVLRPGGVLLLTVPGTIAHLEQGQWRDTWFWGFGPLALQRLFAVAFPADHLKLGSHGNVLASIAFLEGLAAEELEPAELDHQDVLYPLLLTVRATRPAAQAGGAGAGSMSGVGS
jgi:glycosyltransferase involved in cell wall biosynthesis